MIATLSREFLREHWWVFVLRGLAAITFGAIALVWPGLSLATLVLLFGAFALVEGAFALVGALLHREPQWGWHVADGVAGLAIGIMTLVWPIDTAIVLLYFIGAWAVVTGLFRVVHALRGRHLSQPAWLIGIAGLASILFGAWVMIAPGAGALAIIWVIGTYAVFIGVVLVIAGMRLRTMPTVALSPS